MPSLQQSPDDAGLASAEGRARLQRKFITRPLSPIIDKSHDCVRDTQNFRHRTKADLPASFLLWEKTVLSFLKDPWGERPKILMETPPSYV